jgi:hypothetical protein
MMLTHYPNNLAPSHIRAMDGWTEAFVANDVKENQSGAFLRGCLSSAF